MSDSKSTEELREKIRNLPANTHRTSGTLFMDFLRSDELDSLMQLFDQELAKRVEEACNFVIGEDDEPRNTIEHSRRNFLRREQRQRLADLNNQTKEVPPVPYEQADPLNIRRKYE